MGQILSFIIKKCLRGQDQASDYTNRHSSLPISTPELLESLTHTNSSFQLHQNVIDVCIDIVQESSQDSSSSSSSAHVPAVDDLEDTKNGGSDDKNKHSSLSISPLESLESLNDTNSSFKLHQNGADICVDIVQECSKDSAFASSSHVLGVDDLEETKNGGSVDTNQHISLPIPSPESLESSTDTNPSFKLHQNETDICINIVQESSPDSASSSAHDWGVDNLEETKYGSSDDSNKHSSQSISILEFFKSLTDRNSSFDSVQESSQDSASASASAHVLGMNNLERTRNGGPEKWFRHYCSSHKMLLVGEGDFSFSASLAVAFGSAKYMVATSLNSKEFLSKNYGRAMSNIHELRSRGCTVLHGVDATKMANHGFLGGIKFDRIIYNFPHAGFRSNEPVKSERCRHQFLVSSFFKNAKEMIDENGEIHVTHKCNGFFLAWNLKGLASAVGLRLIEEVPFNPADYPGYGTKYGFGGDKNFDCNPSKTYKFGLVHRCSNRRNVPKRRKGKRIK